MSREAHFSQREPGRIRLTEHAASRYHERVKAHLTPAQARAELERLTAGVDRLSDDLPWTRSLVDDYHGYAEIAPGIWLGLSRDGRGWVAATCLTNSCLSDERRAERNAENSARRYAKRFRKYRAGRVAEKEAW